MAVTAQENISGVYDYDSRSPDSRSFASRGQDLEFESSSPKEAVAHEPFLDHGGRTILWATKQKQKDVLDFLLDSGASIESHDLGLRTLLSWAAGLGHEDIVSLLLERGADVLSEDRNHRTPLSWAASNGHEAVVKLLLGKGADAKYGDFLGRTPLSWAAGNGHRCG